MNFEVSIKKKAKKFLLKQNKKDQEKLLRAIYKIPQGDIKRLAGQDGLYRLRVGEFRILYSVAADIITIMILNIGNRGDIYKGL